MNEERRYPKGKYDRELNDSQSWGYCLGISDILTHIANELAELNKNIKKMVKKSE